MEVQIDEMNTTINIEGLDKGVYFISVNESVKKLVVKWTIELWTIGFWTIELWTIGFWTKAFELVQKPMTKSLAST